MVRRSIQHILRNATVVDDSIRFVSQKSKEKQNSSSVREDGKQFTKPDYYDQRVKTKIPKATNSATFLFPNLAFINYYLEITKISYIMC
jgi:hypothetical protein